MRTVSPIFILDSNIVEKFGIVLDFQTRTINIDEITLLMRDINKLSDDTKIKKAWRINNIIGYAINNEPQSTHDATKCVIEILDAKYEKANLRQVVEDDCAHLNSQERAALLELLLEFRSC